MREKEADRERKSESERERERERELVHGASQLNFFGKCQSFS